MSIRGEEVSAFVVCIGTPCHCLITSLSAKGREAHHHVQDESGDEGYVSDHVAK